jgi:hypothetical protein
MHVQMDASYSSIDAAGREMTATAQCASQLRAIPHHMQGNATVAPWSNANACARAHEGNVATPRARPLRAWPLAEDIRCLSVC